MPDMYLGILAGFPGQQDKFPEDPRSQHRAGEIRGDHQHAETHQGENISVGNSVFIRQWQIFCAEVHLHLLRRF